MNSNFKFKNSLEKRKNISYKLQNKYNDKIPIIVESDDNFIKNKIILHNTKYLVPHDTQLGHFIHMLKKKINLNQHQNIFIFIKNEIPINTTLISSLYNQYKDDDGFLYFKINVENVFG